MCNRFDRCSNSFQVFHKFVTTKSTMKDRTVSWWEQSQDCWTVVLFCFVFFWEFWEKILFHTHITDKTSFDQLVKWYQLKALVVLWSPVYREAATFANKILGFEWTTSSSLLLCMLLWPKHAHALTQSKNKAKSIVQNLTADDEAENCTTKLVNSINQTYHSASIIKCNEAKSNESKVCFHSNITTGVFVHYAWRSKLHMRSMYWVIYSNGWWPLIYHSKPIQHNAWNTTWSHE